ncbi:Carboxylesterase [Salinisphaera hydrothermalis C41B8]|uniref:Carboxylesterase n=2 Tax=Salinisphaera TaxID=180541 RepID=A0A084ILZ5_SALHC|nr:carboxylesterase [Salinisphaera hydrothermalis]KEZ77729.1 Carboxylesterase [Salinisphaera hydrothermalis C41B8]
MSFSACPDFAIGTLLMDHIMLDCVEIQPPNPATASVIWLHGLGADGNDFVPIIPELGLGDAHSVRFVFPNAPQQPVTINGGMRMPAWYDIKGADIADKQDRPGIEASTAEIETLIAREIDAGIPADRIVLAGFSQGGAVALHAGLRHNTPLAGIMALSTYLPLHDSLATEASDANRGIPIFMAHGSEDPIVPIALGHGSRDRLLAAGYAVDWHEYPMAHQVCLPEIATIGRWLRERLER